MAMAGDDDRRRLGRIGELAALARTVELIGAYNGAKLLRAALDRELIRWAIDHRRPHAEVDERLRALADDLAAAGHPADLVEALRRTAPIVMARGVVTLADAPATATCRVCGELFVDEPPPTCPTCEAPALTFHEQTPTWFLEPIEPSVALDMLAAGPGRLHAAIGGLPDAQLDRAPRAGEWSARETLEHLVGAEELFATRIRRLLAEHEPDLVAWVPSSGEPPSDEATPATGANAGALLARYIELRTATLARLRDLDDRGWQRGGRHPEWGRVTVLAQAGYFARHQASHEAQLATAGQGRVPGERPGDA